MIYQSKKYIRFLRKSKNQHGIHSPFVYALVTQCFYDKKKYPVYQLINQHRKSLLQSNEVIAVTDFGAGSRIFSSNNRKVAAIAKHAGVSKKRQKLLVRLIRYLGAQQVIELGTSVGLAAAAMGLANTATKITTIEGCPETAGVAKTYFKHSGIENIKVIASTFESYFDSLQQQTFDVIYIDGNHKKENTLHYFNTLLAQAHNETMFIIDDIYWSPSMTEAWEQMIQHPQVTVSIDTFQWGLLFIRNEQQKQHFTIRV